MRTSTPVTVEDYLAYQPPPGMRDELIHGEIILSPAPKTIHHDVAANIYHALRLAIRGTPYLAGQRTNMLLPAENSMPSPDVFVIGKKRWQEAKAADAYPLGAPQIAIEVRSPGNTRLQLRRKIELYLRNGSLAVWVVSTRQQTVTVFRQTSETEYKLGQSIPLPERIVPGYALPIEEIFAGE